MREQNSWLENRRKERGAGPGVGHANVTRQQGASTYVVCEKVVRCVILIMTIWEGNRMLRTPFMEDPCALSTYK